MQQELARLNEPSGSSRRNGNGFLDAQLCEHRPAAGQPAGAEHRATGNPSVTSGLLMNLKIPALFLSIIASAVVESSHQSHLSAAL